ncbi:MAG: hypothetical protein N5P05_000933 [Chroococcopsis gigantea SAG 12.99]|jgi:hypothetical protein|nr:S-layer homology domain-containing protein [Chlorogloea purpurea SAG 13.99]MDV2999327.1 hypothetical protein [Chroococcopsis gigantea SAG 12.99]
MSNLPPPDRPSDRSNDRATLGFDDFIGILIAFASIGAILWWSWSQIGRGKDDTFLGSPSPAPTQTDSVFEKSASDTPRTTVTPLPQSSPDETEIITESTPTPKTAVVPVPVPPVAQTTPSPVKTAAGFTDLTPNYWASPFIAVVVRRGILQGFPDGRFQPEKVVTRSEFAKMLQDSFNESKTRGSLEFKDIPAGDERNTAIDKAVEMEFMKGYPGQVFRPGEPIKKVEALVALSNGLKLPRPASPESITTIYKDNQDIPRYARESVATATQFGLVASYPDTNILAPNRDLTRAEAAVIIHQALVNSGRVEKISSPYIVQSP